jgi:16S rRNA (cytosine1402-N4)-methyltransferase
MSHTAVLLQEVIESLNPLPGGVFVDGTFGAGGHSRLIAEKIGKNGKLFAFDADRNVFSDSVVDDLNTLTKFTPICANFRELNEKLTERGMQSIDGALFDLGLSSTQLEESGRGFTFLKDEPLEMTFKAMPEAGDVTAAMVLNEWSEETLASVLKGFGEERFSRKIASAIVKARKVGPIRTTGQLVEVIHEATPIWYQRGRTHFATRTFQAIRMAVNDELGAISAGIRDAVKLLRPGGRVAVITFHSIEDRAVKRLLRECMNEGIVSLVTKKPIIPKRAELVENRRARSAKLRVAEKNP